MKLGVALQRIGISTAVLLTAACGAKSSSTTDNPTTTDAGGTGGGTTTSTNKIGTASSIADLKLAGALAIKLPEAFGGSASGSALRLLAGKKSQEACMMGEAIQQSTRRLGEVGGFFCHLEVEKDRMKFGKKYKIMTAQGEFARLWVDNSQASTTGKMTIGFCSNNEDNGQTQRNKQFITIDALTEAGPKGSVVNDGTGTYQNNAFSYGSSTTFDASVADVVSLAGKDMHSQSGNTFVREIALKLQKTGTSSLKLANKGMSSFGEFLDRGLAFVSSDKGSVLFQSKGQDGQGNAFDFSRRAHFSKSGEVLGAADVGAELQPPVADLPPYLPSDFKPDALTGWVGQDCPDFDEEITLDPQSAAHAACDQGSDSQLDCWDQSKYEASNETVSVQ